MDYKLRDTMTQISNLQEKVYLQEQIVYDFRKDLASTINESEKFLNKKTEVLSKAIGSMARELQITNPLLNCLWFVIGINRDL